MSTHCAAARGSKAHAAFLLRHQARWSELEDIQGFGGGDLEMGIPSRNLIMWQELTSEAVNALEELREARARVLINAQTLEGPLWGATTYCAHSELFRF